MKAFVIGGAGFVGSHLVARLIQRGDEVFVYDNLSSGKILWVPEPARFYKGHAQDGDRLRVVMAEAAPDVVFHLAANPDIARAVTEPTIDFDQGTILTQNVLEAMRCNGVRRLIYASGSGVYGEANEVFREDYGPMEPISTYGASKLASEALISAYCRMFGLVARCFRFANLVGPRQTHGVGYDFLRRLRSDPTRLRILGDGTQLKSYLHVSDALGAVMLVVDRCIAEEVEAPHPYVVYNVATSDALTVNQIAAMACLVSDLHPSMVTKEYTGGDRGWAGDVPRVRLNCGKIHSLGWRPKFNAMEAMGLALQAMAEELKAR